MDNEAFDLLNKTLLNKKIPYQLVPLHIHRLNYAERSIQPFKDHFITVLCSTDPKYPAQEWYRLLPQATMTINLLCTYRTNPKLSAYVTIIGIN